MQDWYSPDIEVLIRDTHEDSGLIGQIGVVRGVTPGMCSVFLPDEDRTVNIPAEHLQPVQPVRGDRVKVIMGKSLIHSHIFGTIHTAYVLLFGEFSNLW